MYSADVSSHHFEVLEIPSLLLQYDEVIMNPPRSKLRGGFIFPTCHFMLRSHSLENAF